MRGLRGIAWAANTKSVPNGIDLRRRIIGPFSNEKEGAPRSEPHVDRKLSAIEAIERDSRSKRVPGSQLRRCREGNGDAANGQFSQHAIS